ncbi:ATP-binding protein [Desulfosarcina ovata]|uniref:histidine kinase n=1 Tax=Desulfosarcina ovata subsp. ovata TaxID=2752305 RepID=A0A5K8ACE3_9BACT|nr:ATP-binding protein [Desulfosarcina ovata]BBO90393.1 histidine kinase [Desulfosarcina ovata subsp. ovata]
MLKQPILIIDHAPHVETLAPTLVDLGYRVVSARSSGDGLREFDTMRPPWVIVNAATAGVSDMMDSIRLRDATVQILMTTTGPVETVMAEYRGRADEFLSLPAAPLVLEVVLQRMEQTVRLHRRIRSFSENLESRARGSVREVIDTERFLAVRQIVEKMSIFIGQVARSAQGGMRYFNQLPYFVSIHNRDCTLLAANSIYLRHLGNRLNQDSWGIYVGRRGTRNGCPVGRTLRKESVLNTSALVRYASGVRVPVNVHTAPIYDNDGNIELVIEIFAGTKEIDRLAEESRHTQQRYEQLFNAVPSSIVVLDRRFRINAINRRFRENFGECSGRLFFDVFRPGIFPAYRDPITRTIRTGEAQQGEMLLTNNDGLKVNMMAWTAPIKTVSGKLVQVLVIFADVTQVRKLQANLANLGLMVSTLSHDMKGCLTGLDAGMYLIDSGFYRNRPGRIEEGLDATKLMVERIRKLIMDILYYAKERPLNPAMVNIVQFAGDVVANVELKVRGANIRFNPKFPEKTVEMEIDADLMRTALLNLIDNAVETCIENPADKESRIDFELWVDRSSVGFTIEDTGGGMSAKKVDSIFDLFYSTKGRGGTGIGLYVTRKIIQKHNGTLSVHSEPGKGSRFEIVLPRGFHRQSA